MADTQEPVKPKEDKISKWLRRLQVTLLFLHLPGAIGVSAMAAVAAGLGEAWGDALVGGIICAVLLAAALASGVYYAGSNERSEALLQSVASRWYVTIPVGLASAFLSIGYLFAVVKLADKSALVGTLLALVLAPLMGWVYRLVIVSHVIVAFRLSDRFLNRRWF